MYGDNVRGTGFRHRVIRVLSLLRSTLPDWPAGRPFRLLRSTGFRLLLLVLVLVA